MLQNQATGAAKLFEGPNYSFMLNLQIQLQQAPVRVQPPPNIPVQPPAPPPKNLESKPTAEQELSKKK